MDFTYYVERMHTDSSASSAYHSRTEETKSKRVGGHQHHHERYPATCTGRLSLTGGIYADTYVSLSINPPVMISFIYLFALKKRADDPYAILNIKEIAFL